MRRRRWQLVTVACSLAIGLPTLGAGPAFAACHRFTVDVSPKQVDEGGSITVTVTRDAAANPSSIDVATVDESAKAGSDYTALQRTVSFTAEVSQTFPLATTNDAVTEPAESFRIRLSNPGGCPINSNFVVGPDAKVTIVDNDIAQIATTARPPGTSPATTARVATTRASVTTTTATSSVVPLTTEATLVTTEEATTEEATTTSRPAPKADEDGGDSAALVAVLVALGALAAVGYLLWSRRRAQQPRT